MKQADLSLTKRQIELLVAANSAVTQALDRLNLLQAMVFAQHGIEGNWQIVGLEHGENPHATIREEAVP